MGGEAVVSMPVVGGRVSDGVVAEGGGSASAVAKSAEGVIAADVELAILGSGFVEAGVVVQARAATNATAERQELLTQKGMGVIDIAPQATVYFLDGGINVQSPISMRRRSINPTADHAQDRST